MRDVLSSRRGSLVVSVDGALHDLEAMTTIGILKKGEDDSPVIDPRFSEVVDSLVAELEN